MWIFNCILFLFVFNLSSGQRRIRHGHNVTISKSYMVYLIKRSAHTPRNYDNWLCGGTLVKPELVVTSAACLVDIEFALVISGTNTYYANPEDNECTSRIKKRVIMTYRYTTYEMNYAKVNKWANVDIGIAKLEQPLSPDAFMKEFCDHTPQAILVNYKPHMELPGSNAMVLGWGHKSHWRKTDDKTDMNEKQLQYITTNIVPKHICEEAYLPYGMGSIINNYMICARGRAGLDESGLEVDYEVNAVFFDPGPAGCDPSQEELDSENGTKCVISRRRNNGKLTNLLNNKTESYGKNGTINPKLLSNTRRHGICQNDHGGPMIAWENGQEWLIGVASVFMVNNDSLCVGPYLYTSTVCTNAFLQCVIDPSNIKRIGRRQCDLPPHEKGYDIIKKEHSWKGHPDGPAYNEIDEFDEFDKLDSTPEILYNENNIDNTTIGNATHSPENVNTPLNSIDGTEILNTNVNTSTNGTGILNTVSKLSINETEIPNKNNNTNSRTYINDTEVNMKIKTSMNATETSNLDRNSFNRTAVYRIFTSLTNKTEAENQGSTSRVFVTETDNSKIFGTLLNRPEFQSTTFKTATNNYIHNTTLATTKNKTKPPNTNPKT